MEAHKRIRLAIVLTSLLGAAAHAESIHKWIDDEGVTHFSSRPPPRSAATAQTFDLNANMVEGPLKNPKGELQHRIVQYTRYIELLRNIRAAELGITREKLDALEAAGALD
jgi:hypothetical protein